MCHQKVHHCCKQNVTLKQATILMYCENYKKMITQISTETLITTFRSGAKSALQALSPHPCCARLSSHYGCIRDRQNTPIHDSEGQM